MIRKAGDMLTKNFSKDEFRCRCRLPECDALPMDKTFMRMLQALRDDWGIPLKPTSGQRCRKWNAKVGGATSSQHLYGKAADFWFEHPSDTLAFVELAEKHGFGGIGAGMHLVHVDSRDGWARWEYRD